MKLRNLVITVAVLAALAAVAFLRNRPLPSRTDDPRVGKALLGPDTASRAAGVLVADQGKKIELVRAADGSWTVPSYFDMPADFEKIARLVGDLNEAKVERFVTANPDRLARLEFKDSMIALRDAGGNEIWSVNLGKTPDNGNGRFIRFGSEPRAYLANLHAWLDTDGKSWADARLVTVKADEVAKVEVFFEQGATVAVSRTKKDSPWLAAKAPAGQRLVSDKVTSVLSTLASLRFSDTSDAKDAAALEAAKHLRTFRLTGFDGTTLDVALGRTPEEKKLKAPVANATDAIAPPSMQEGAKPEVKPISPEFETIPAGPVFVTVSSSDAKAPINAQMKRRAFKVDDFTFTGLPQKPDEFFEAEKAK